MTVSAYPPTPTRPLLQVSHSPTPTTPLPHPGAAPPSPSGTPLLVSYGARPRAAPVLAHRPLLSHGRGVVRARLISPRSPPLPPGWLGARQDGEERRYVTVPSPFCHTLRSRPRTPGCSLRVGVLEERLILLCAPLEI